MKINGHEFEFSYVNSADAIRLSEAGKRIAGRLEEIEKAQKESWGSVVRVTIDCYREYLKTATGIDILEGCDDIETAEAAYFDFLGEVAVQEKEYREKRVERINHYSELKGLV